MNTTMDNLEKIEIYKKGIASQFVDEEFKEEMRKKIAELEGVTGKKTDDSTDFDFEKSKIENKIQSQERSKALGDQFVELGKFQKNQSSQQDIKEAIELLQDLPETDETKEAIELLSDLLEEPKFEKGGKVWNGTGTDVYSFIKGDEVYRKTDSEPFGMVSSIGSKKVQVKRYSDNKVVAIEPTKLWLGKNLHLRKKM